ncbi:FimV/HubP family polar landmark protein [Woeseia oceani]|uniref:FimV/HubP family polar landmark protein n=1 Tax=Woeseia oceani TaxID=1548547 RepID=UPI0009F58F7B|nr:FimV/HubP family polar landmark protein [Woeseia oceani]
MSRRLNRSWILLVCLLTSEVWALGLGDIRLNSALNEPLRAEIQLLSATPEELQNLKINLASAEAFERYGIDRPLYLSRLVFSVQQNASGHVVRVTSNDPVTEPFVTFLVEAEWSQGRLLREYTVLLDPPTFAPPPATASTETVSAPRQAAQTDRGRIDRPATPTPRQSTASSAARSDQNDSFATTAGGDYQVRRGDTLWRIAEQVRTDNRLSMNQTMLAIYQANPDAFAGNINVLRANARLRIPSADEIFRISRGNALSEIQRQNQAWDGDATSAAPQTTLTLVPPDGEQRPYQGATSGSDAATGAANAAAQQRIRQLEERVSQQESLLNVRDNELAELRSELTRLREERAAAANASDMTEPAVEPEAAPEDPAAEIFVDDAEVADSATDQPAIESEPAEVAEPAAPPAPRVSTISRQEPGLVDKIIGALTGIWGMIGAALLIVLGILVWFARRASGGSDDADSTGVWDALDAEDEVDSESLASTERLRAMARDDDSSIVVVEQQGGDTIAGEPTGDTVESPGLHETADPAAPVSLEDTFSSETAINLDQSDPVAEADFHMAYGLYDQAADLINGALAVEPQRTDLLAKLSEIYFVWGNRDGFVDAATRLDAALGDGDRGVWDKIVIMGQQIASDHDMFSNASTAGATREVDLDFESSGDDDAALDIDFAGGGPDGAFSDVIDLGDGDSDQDDGLFGSSSDDDNALDFSFDDEVDTGASITQAMPEGDDDATVESPTLESPTVEQTAIRDEADSTDGTSRLPSLAGLDDLDLGSPSGDATAEIDLDDLGLDLDGLTDDFGDDDATGNRLVDDELIETGSNPMLDIGEETGTDIDVTVENNLLDATGETQVLPDDFAIETSTNIAAQLDDDDATMLAPGMSSADEPDFDFAKTEALPSDSFDDSSLDATTESPGLAGSTDMDLDLDDLTAALKLSEAGDTVEQLRDDATVEQPRIGGSDFDADIDFDLGLGGDDPTQALGPDDVSDELQEARTMTEVGTKLDLARAYVDMGDPSGARNILDEVLEEGDESQRQQAQQLLDSLPS